MNITTLIATLQQQLAALGDGHDAKSDNERARYRNSYDRIQRVITGLMNAPDDLARAVTRLDDLNARRAAVVAKADEIDRLLADAPSVTNARERDQEIERQRHLRRQLERLRDGTLLRAPDTPFERLDALDAEIVRWTARRDTYQAAVDAAVRDAEALVADPVPAP
jgi:hypothetical protein